VCELVKVKKVLSADDPNSMVFSKWRKIGKEDGIALADPVSVVVLT